MTIRSTVYLFLMAIIFFIALSNCTSTKKEEGVVQVDAEKSAVPQYQVDMAFQQQLSDIFISYVALKDAFVASDTALVKSQISAVKQALSNVNMELVSGEAHDKWMEYMTGMDGALMEMKGTNDMEAQRGSFSIFSDNLYTSLKAFGTGGVKAYYEYCPMAFNNKGAYWLSESEQIRNPYFGDKMLSCGSVKETIE